MTTITFDEEFDLGKTHFKNEEEFIALYEEVYGVSSEIL
jgi:hypothetical protein